MHLARRLFFIRAFFHISVWAVHVPGQQNCMADAILRNNLVYLLSQVPEAASRQTVIPTALLTLLAEQQPNWISPAWRQLFKNCFQLGSPLHAENV